MYSGAFASVFLSDTKEICMQKKVKVMILGIITALVLGFPLAAQDVSQSIGGLSSNTNTATATLFKADADNFMTVDRWSRVSFDKGFAFISGSVFTGTNPDTKTSTSNLNRGKLGLGYATELGSLYLGVWFQGNIVQVTKPASGDTEKTTVTSEYDDDSRTLLSTTKTTEYGESWINSANQVQLLLGVANQGIKLGFYESLAQNKQTGNTSNPTTEIDYKDGNRKDYFNTVDEYAHDKGYLRPYLGWGTDVAVGSKLKLRPYIDLGIEVYKDELIDKYSDYTKINGKKQDNAKTTFGEGHSNGYIAPQATVGAKFDIPTEKGAVTTTILEYAIDLRLFKNSAEATGFSDKAIKGTVGWSDGAQVKQVTKYVDGHTETATDITLNYDEQKYAKHTITPTWQITGSPASGFNLGFKTNVPVAITASSSEKYSEEHNLTSIKNTAESYNDYTSTIITRDNGAKTTSTDTNLKWNLMVGAQYKLVPDRFTINAGITATPIDLLHSVARTAGNNVNSVKTTLVKDGNGNVITDDKDVDSNTSVADSVATTNTWAGFNGGVSGGFTLNFTPKVALDLAVDSYGQNFKLNVANVHVLLSLKY